MEPTYTVAELSRVIARTVARAFPQQVWVEGEIRDLSRSRRGHVYFTLVDPADEAEVAAALPVTLFAADKEAVNRVLIRSGAMRMTDGVHVRIRGQVGHYAPRSVVQLRMTWIDTDYTVGRLAAARRALLRKLEATGDVGRNASLDLPELPMRIGLVTSVGSAAYADFLTELERSGFGFAVTVVDARVQGAEAAASITAAIGSLDAAPVDIVAIVRGGGAQTDLAAFDTEAVALAIAGAVHPVFTGIGHEIDTTVADHVAAASLKTPTACAQRLVAMVAAASARLDTAGERIVRTAAEALRRAGMRSTTTQRRIAAAAQMHLTRHDARIGGAAAILALHGPQGAHRAGRRLESLARRSVAAAARATIAEESRVASAAGRLAMGSRRALAAARRRIEALEALRRAHAPERMLARGWSVTYGADRRVLRSPAAVSAGQRIRTQLLEGDIVSRVEDHEEPAPS